MMRIVAERDNDVSSKTKTFATSPRNLLKTRMKEDREMPPQKKAFRFTHTASRLAGVMAVYLERSMAFSHSKNFMPFSVYGLRPKWPYAAVTWYFGSRNCRDFAMAPGRQSKAIFTICVMASGVNFPVSVP